MPILSTPIAGLADEVTITKATGSFAIKAGGVDTTQLAVDACDSTIVDVVALDSDGKVNAITSTEFASLDGSDLTNIPSMVFGGGLDALTTAQNADKYWSINSVHSEATDEQSTEVNSHITIPRAGTLQNLRVFMTTRGHGSVIFMVRINGGDTGITVTANSDGAEFTDLVNTQAVVAGDEITMEIGTSDDAGATTCSWGVEFR